VVQAVDFGRGVEDAWSTVAAFVPKLVAFLVILLIGWLVAKAVEKILDKVLERVGFDRWVERGGIKRALANSKYDASSILGRIVYYAILLFALSTAFGVFGPNPISAYLAAIVGYLPKIFVAILILVIAAAIAAAVKNLIENTLGGLSYGRLLATIASVVILVIGVTAALNQLQIATAVVNAVLYAALAAVAGIAIVAIGGGGIRPMQQRWERALGRYDAEKPVLAQQARQAPSVRQQAQQAYQQAQPDQPDQPDQYGYPTTDGATAAPTQQYGGGYPQR
jgi:hypothetical protein